MRILALVAVAACSSSHHSEWPPGSKITPNICFEHEAADGGWEPAQVRYPDGRSPVKTEAFAKPAYFSMDAGALRVRPCD